MAKYLLGGLFISLAVMLGQVATPAAVRVALARQYERIDAALAAGRTEEILAIALPEARGGSLSGRVPFAQHVAEWRKLRAAGKTSIVAVTLVYGEARALTRGESRVVFGGRTRTMHHSSEDFWVERDGVWRLRETTVTGMREVAGTLDAETVARVGGAISAMATPLTDDLAAFGKAVGDARIVSLGEASHGTREIFQTKQRLIEYLVKEKGFTVVAFEANWPESQAADRYVKTGVGDPRRALRDMYFWIWQTEEVVALLEWMRAYDMAPGKHPILSFTGFDMQRGEVAAGRLLAFARKFGVPAETEQLESRRDELVKAAGAAAYRDAVQMSRIVAQANRIAAPSTPLGYRDEMMAKNVEWLANEAYRGEKIVLWAHNGHVSANEEGSSGVRPMGWWLRQSFGRAMYVLGFGIHTGSVRAYSGIHQMPPAPAGSGTSVLSAAGIPAFFLDFGTVRAGTELSEWLRSNSQFREIGAVWQLEEPAENNTMVNAPGKSYDGLIYFEKSEATKSMN